MYDFPKLMWVENIEGTVQLYAHVIAWCQNSYLSFYHSKLARAEKNKKALRAKASINNSVEYNGAESMNSAGMGEGALAPTGNVVKCFCALVTNKCCGKSQWTM